VGAHSWAVGIESHGDSSCMHCLEVVIVKGQRLGTHLTYSMMDLSNQKSISDKHMYSIMTSVTG